MKIINTLISCTPKLASTILVMVFFFSLLNGTAQTTMVADTVIVDTSASSHSPRVAVISSLLVPGLGQIYNKKYWKAPIVWVGIGASTVAFIYNTKTYIDYNRTLDDLIRYKYNTIPEEELIQNMLKRKIIRKTDSIDLGRDYESLLSNVEANRSSFSRYKNLSIIAFAGVYFLNVIDAMVDANFFDYDIKDDLSMHFQPNIIRLTNYSYNYGFRLSINF